MAVVISTDEVLNALRIDTGNSVVTTEIERLIAWATDVVLRHAPVADNSAHGQSVVQLVGYAYDRPTTYRQASFANVLRNSGAGQTLLPYRIMRAGNVGGSVGATPVTDPAVVPDMSPTDTDALMRAIADYLTANPMPGAKGDKGDRGDRGDRGDAGNDSTVAGPRGQRGLTGADSTVAGPKGDKGDAGDAANATEILAVADEAAANADGDRAGVLYLLVA